MGRKKKDVTAEDEPKRKRAISNRNFLNKKYKVAEFEGKWKASFGKPVLNGVWIVYGGSGNGKTSFLLELAKYLTQFGKVRYNSLEQGDGSSLQNQWIQAGMADAGTAIDLWDGYQVKEMREGLKKPRAPKIVIIDSLPYLFNFNFRELQRLKQQFPKVLFIFVAHEKKGEPDGALAMKVKYDAEIKIHVQGFTAFITSRFAVPEKGEGGQPFQIWDSGSEHFHGGEEALQQEQQ